MIEQTLPYILLILAIPLGLLLATMTEDEKKIYKQKRYLPTIMILFAILGVVGWFIQKELFFTGTFMTITLSTWLQRYT
jgi:hypothetical protein